MKLLSGYKTYLYVAVASGVFAAHLLGFINDAIYQQALAFLGFGSVAALRAAVGGKQA